MNKRLFCLAAFLVLMQLAVIASAEDNMSNTTGDALADENISDEMPLNLTANETPMADNETPGEAIIMVCSEMQCDDGCVVCGDDRCHEQGFLCVEELKIEKIFPSALSIGITQMNILLNNTGNVELKNISAELSGDGISTLEKIPAAALPAGDKDYTFTKIKAAKSGIIDLVIKLYLGENLKDTIVRQLTVLEEKLNASNATAEVNTINATEIADGLDRLKDIYLELEQDYQNKKLQNYYVDMVYDNMKDANKQIDDAQLYVIEGDYKKAQLRLKLVEDSLDNIKNELKNAKKQEKNLSDAIKSNMLYIGSIAAAIVSILTALSLVRSHVNKQKLMELHGKIKPKKEEAKEEKEEEKSK